MDKISVLSFRVINEDAALADLLYRNVQELWTPMKRQTELRAGSL